MILKVIRSALIITTIAGCGSAAAWDAVATFRSSLPTDFVPRGTTMPDATGYWAWGTAYDAPLLVRYDNAGVPQFIRYTQAEFSAERIFLKAMPDGGALVSYVDGFTSLHCVFRRYDAAGNLRWTNPSVPIPASFGNCAPLAVDGDGGVWIPGYRLGVDGSVGHSFSLDIGGGAHGDPHGPNLFTVGSVPNAAVENSTFAAVAKTAASGQAIWKWQAPSADASSILQRVVIGADGQIYAFGTIGASPDLHLYAASLTPEGATRWTRTYADLAIVTVADVSDIVAQGTLISLIQPSGSDSITTVLKIGTDGAVTWSHSAAEPAFQCGAVLRSAGNGDSLVLGACQASAIELSRYSPSGSVLFSKTLAASILVDVGVLADGSSLLTLQPGASPLPPARFEHDARDGSALPAPQTGGIVPALDYFGGGAFDASGAAYFVSRNAISQESTLTRVAADDSVTWQQRIDGAWASSGQPAVVLAGNSVCVAGTLDTNEVVRCYAAASGQPSAATQLDHGIGANNYTIAGGIGNGDVVVFYFGSDQKAHHALIAANGSILHDLAVLGPSESLVSTSINAAGDALVRVSSNAYALIAADGSRRFTQTLGADAGGVLQTYLADDGWGLLLTTKGGLSLARVDAGGVVQWTQPAPVGTSTSYNYAPSIRVAGGNAYVVLGFHGLVYGEALGRFPALVFTVSLADGAIGWSTGVQTGLYNFPSLMLDAEAKNVLAIAGLANKISEVVLDTASGATRDARFEACAIANCTLVRYGMRGDGALRVLVDSGNDGSGYLRQMYTRQHPFAGSTAIRVGQPGISGAWFPTYAAGQGFTLDYIASAATIFMPWFTFASNGDQYAMYGINEPSGLAWYALQGAAPANATSADLVIAVTEPGAFNTGQVAGHEVGSAHLTFSDCDNATLYFQFDAGINASAGGLISLTRLTPGTAPCLLADGSTAPAQNGNAPANGFDTRQSGSWFDPDTGGQGLELTIIPAGNGSNGLLFAAWFTFDPSGQADDLANQHWFTLQGDLANATNGKVTLPVYRIIGGSFNDTPTQNFAQVGHVTLTMHGCDSAQLDYQFDTSEVAHAFSGLSGTSRLTKIGGCAAQ